MLYIIYMLSETHIYVIYIYPAAIYIYKIYKHISMLHIYNICIQAHMLYIHTREAQKPTSNVMLSKYMLSAPIYRKAAVQRARRRQRVRGAARCARVSARQQQAAGVPAR